MNATISEDDKNRIKLYLLGQLAETDEERLELRLMSDPAFSEEFDIAVDEIAIQYVLRHCTGEEKTRIEQYFLRSPDRQAKVKFICELLRQVNEDGDDHGVVPVRINDQRPTLWQRVSSLLSQPSLSRPAISFAILLIVAGLSFWAFSNRHKPTYQSFELAMISSERSTGTTRTRIHLDSGVDGLRIKLKLPGPTASQYRASMRAAGNPVQLAIETQDADSITVIVPASEITRGTHAIEVTEINNGRETPLRGSYEFVID